jgi:hypothetical protein
MKYENVPCDLIACMAQKNRNSSKSGSFPELDLHAEAMVDSELVYTYF